MYLYTTDMKYLYFLISIEINSIKKCKSHVMYECSFEESNYDYLKILMNNLHLIKKLINMTFIKKLSIYRYF